MTATALATERQVRRIAFGNRLSHWDFKLSPYLYVSPFFILFAITGLFPIIYTAYVSVFDWHIIGGQGDFVGAGNFEWVLGQEKFWIALRNSFSIFLLSAIPQVILALIIAAVLSQNLRNKTFWRMGVLVPYVSPPSPSRSSSATCSATSTASSTTSSDASASTRSAGTRRSCPATSRSPPW